MAEARLTALCVPKWGLSMAAGKLVGWLVEEGAEVERGADVAEVETDKIAGLVEAPGSGRLVRQVARVGQVLPVGALLGVIAEGEASDAEIDAFLADFEQASGALAAAARESEPEPETVEVDGRWLRFARYGGGEESLVLVHGFGGDLEAWLFNAEALASGRTVLALDLPGHGESTCDVGDGSVDTLAEVLGRFVADRCPGPVHLAGHSLGGEVAALCALADPGRVASLTLIASAGLGPEIDADYLAGFLAASTRRELKGVLERLFADPELVTRQLLDRVLRHTRRDDATEALRRIAASLCPQGRQTRLVASELAASQLPILVIWGEHDRIIPAAHASALAGRARIEVLPGQGHSPHLEAASTVNGLVEEFLRAGAA